MLRANRHGCMNVPELFDIALSTLNALVYFMTNTYIYKLVYTIVRKNFVMFSPSSQRRNMMYE